MYWRNYKTGEYMELKPIGIIHSPYTKKAQAPHQGRFSSKKSHIIIFDEFLEGLDGIDKYKHLIIIYWLDKARRDILKVVPHGRTKKRGVFSTRAPVRPNPLAYSVVELLEHKKNKLVVKGLEALDGTPLVDIKPYWADLDSVK